MTVYIGYHGTDKVSAEKISSNQSFHPSLKDDEWLGKGIYFYWNSDDAHWWCSTVKALRCYAVLKANLVGTEIVDLVHNRKDQLKFKEFCDMVANKCDRLPNGKKRKNYMSMAIKIMVKGNSPDIIVESFDENRKFWFTSAEMKKKFPVLPGQVQICVLNSACISDIQVSEEVG